MKINDLLSEKIKDLYLQGYSTIQIRDIISESENIDVCSQSIRNKLIKLGVSLRNRKESIISHYRKEEPIHEIIELYSKNVPVRELSRKFAMGRKTINKILSENNIIIKDSRSALVAMGHISEKKKFSLDPKEKAYLFGLVMGDLTPVRISNYTLNLITHSTHKTFMDLLYETFEKYGPTKFTTTKNINMFRFQSYIDLESFIFLLDTKKGIIPNWINSKNFMHFLAGYIDSDGSIITKKSGKYFQFVIRFFGQNKKLLEEIKTRLERMGYNLSMHKNHSKGDTSYHNGRVFRYNKDYYVLETFKKHQTLDLIEKIPIRHPEKIAKIKLMKKIKNTGYVHWLDVKFDVKKLKEKIKQSVIQQTNLKNLI